MRLALMNWRQVDAYLEERNTLIIPAGSTEQHGPNGLIGTDTLIAEALADAIGERSGTPSHPPLTVGMSQHHLAFAGTSSFTSATFMTVINEVVETQSRHGFRRFFFINGHGGNTTPAMAAICDLITRRPGLEWAWHSWWTHPQVKALEDKLFGERNGDHASAAEISITHHLYPGAVEPIAPVEIQRPDFRWPLSPEKFRATFPDGRMMSDPSLADAVKGRKLFELCVEVLSEELLNFEAS
jgi:creatinine amidohydrolase